MQQQLNRRGHEEASFDKQHLKLNDLKQKAARLGNQYLFKGNIPAYPQAEFHACRLRHDTDRKGLRGIRRDDGFRNPGQDSLLWWSLVVGPDEITSAETRLLETTYPDRTEEQAQMQQSFLGRFTTSPAFKKISRLGSYRFTFPLEELLKAYREQFCGGAEPVMRVYKTRLYKQAVVYVVLVHSPASDEEFKDYPLLNDYPNPVCTYKDGCFIWRSEAMCETHSCELVLRPDENQIEVVDADRYHQFYVWDNVAVALHVEEKVLSFDADRLRENLKFCSDQQHGMIKGVMFEDFPKAEELVSELWPDSTAPLEVDEELNSSSAEEKPN